MIDDLTISVEPAYIEAEWSLLGCLLHEPATVDGVRQTLRADHFGRTANRVLFQAICRLVDDGKPVDPVPLFGLLRRARQIDAVGGEDYVRGLYSAMPDVANVESYADTVLNAGRARLFLETLKKAEAAVRNRPDGQSVTDALNAAQTLLDPVFDAAARGATNRYRDILLRVTDDVMERQDGATGVRGIRTGFPELDRCIDGLCPKRLIVLVARTGFGKTALGTQIAAHVATKERQSVGIISLEMDEEDLVQRMHCSLALIDSQRIRDQALTQDDWNRWMDRVKDMDDANLHIDASFDENISAVEATIRAMVRTYGIRLAVVDYVQLITITPTSHNKAQDLAAIMRRLKKLARKLDVCILVIGQVGRSADKRADDNAPELADISDSSAIEKDADAVVIIHNPEKRKRATTDTPPEVEAVTLMVRKNRYGPDAAIQTLMHPKYARFGEIEWYLEPPSEPTGF